MNTLALFIVDGVFPNGVERNGVGVWAGSPSEAREVAERELDLTAVRCSLAYHQPPALYRDEVAPHVVS